MKEVTHTFYDYTGKISVYYIKNKINNNFYVGSTKNLRNRIMNHLCLLNNNKHDNHHLQYAWNKYGKNNFEILAMVEEDITIEKAREIEQLEIDKFLRTGKLYNIVPSVDNLKLSEETKKKLRFSRIQQSRRLKISENDEKDICVLYLNGISTTGLGKKYNVDDEIIRRILIENRVERRNFYISDEIKQAIIYDAKSKISPSQIMNKYNICAPTFYNILNKAKIKLYSQDEKIINENEKQEIVRLYNLDISAKEISKKLGVCNSTVYKILKEFGIKANTISQEIIDKVINLSKNGLNAYNISKQINISYPSICNILRENGLMKARKSRLSNNTKQEV